MRFKLVGIIAIIVGYTVLGASTTEASILKTSLISPLQVAEDNYSLTDNTIINGEKPVEKEVTGKKLTANLSAYTAAADECGKSDGITASGAKVTPNRTLACPKGYAFGTKVYIEGMGEYTCEDRGGAIKGNKFDIYMVTKAEAFSFGRRNLEVTVIQ
jgi:3D (Asp-Asp-Asp) domain-containing protein